MHWYKTFGYLLIVGQLIVSINKVYSQPFLEAMPNIKGEVESSIFKFQYFPSFNVGTHQNQVSVNFSASSSISSKNGITNGLKYSSSFQYNQTKLGIPGTSVTWVNQLMWRISNGPASVYFRNDYFNKYYKRNNLEYHYMHYWANDGTSQFSGGLNFIRVSGPNLFKISLENDIMGWYGRDEFRTGGLLIDYKKRVNDRLYGLGVGLKLWTGSIRGMTILDFGEYYDMSKQYGSDYSHGIAYVNLYYQNYSLSVGYDSEAIRIGSQRFIHRMVNDGLVPTAKYARQGIYLQFCFMPLAFLY